VNADLRTALLVGALVFVGLFTAMTISVAADDGVDVLVVLALGIALMFAIALIGALRNPPN